MSTLESSEGDESTVLSLCVLGRFSVLRGDQVVDVAPASQKVLTLIALNGGAAHRSRLACLVWPDSADDQAMANLRSAMWRMPESVRTRVERHGMSINLSRGWVVDIDTTTRAADQLRANACHRGIDHSLFATDLLPDWDIDWLVVPREQHRQLRLHALETLAEAQLAGNEPLDAVDTAMQAVSAEPLRESAQLLLLKAHLQAGNRADVVRRFHDFSEILSAELSLKPSAEMQAVLALARA